MLFKDMMYNFSFPCIIFLKMRHQREGTSKSYQIQEQTFCNNMFFFSSKKVSYDDNIPDNSSSHI